MSSINDIIKLLPKQFSAEPLLDSKLIRYLLSEKDVIEAEFDQIFPPYYQFQSAVHWSSISVARQVANWIKPLNRKSIIDIGCGVGKLCFLLRIMTDYEIFGIEQRTKLVKVAHKIIKVNGFNNISIARMNMLDLNWDLYDIYYLYNPFQEHVVDDSLGIIENDIEFDKKNYAYYTSEVFRQLTWAQPGKILITFHGYGGNVPQTWRMLENRHIENGDLTMWVKE